MRLFEELEGQEHSMILKLFMWNTFLGALLIMSHLFSHFLLPKLWSLDPLKYHLVLFLLKQMAG